MTTAQQVLDLARSQLGTVEARDGSTPYHRAYGLPFSQPWCAVFLWDMFRRAGASELLHPKTAYTPTLAQWFRDRNAWTAATPTVGALVFFNWPGDRVDRIQHVGIVEAIEPGTVVTIEGNTSSGNAGSQSNGGGVWRRRRTRNGSIVGYGHPAYAAATTPAAPLAPTPEGFLMALSDAEQREILDGIRKLKPGTTLPARSKAWGDRVDDQFGWTISGAAAAADAAVGVQAVLDRLASAAVPGPAQLSDADVKRIVAGVGEWFKQHLTS